MLRVSSLQSGLLMVFLAGAFNVLMMAWSKILKQRRWPYFRLMGTGFFVLWIGIGCALSYFRTPMPAARIRKWVVLRGSFAFLNFFLFVLAVRLGAPLGDAASLSSINMVIAALLGRVFLSEPFSMLYGLALGCSLAGAVLVSRPSFLFAPSEASEEGSSLAYLMAVLGGVVQGCIFICARKAAGTSVLIMAFSSMFQASWPFWLLPYLGLIDDFSFQVAEAAPAEALCWICALTVTVGGTNMLLTAGSMQCPAAISSLIFTSTQMAVGYVAQVVFFSMIPDALNLMGALLMFVGVCVMAYSGWRDARSAYQAQSAAPTTFEGVLPDGAADEDDDAESLASFVAREFGGSASPQEQHTRRRGGAEATNREHEPPAQVFGAD